MDEQIKLCSVPHLEPVEKKTQKRKKISIKEKRAQGGFISPKAEDQIKQIINSIHKKERSKII